MHFRVIPLTPQLTPYHGVVDVFIYNPDGYLQRRYPAVHSNFGVVSIGFLLATELKFGTWKIRAQIGPISQDLEFPVEEFSMFTQMANNIDPKGDFSFSLNHKALLAFGD